MASGDFGGIAVDPEEPIDNDLGDFGGVPVQDQATWAEQTRIEEQFKDADDWVTMRSGVSGAKNAAALS